MKSLSRAIGTFVGSSVGKKILVALSGLALLVFLAGHLAGNLLVYRGPEEINAYAHELKTLLHGSFLWIARAGLLLCVLVHIYFTVALTRENKVARRTHYAQKKSTRSTVAGRTMILSGLVILAFIIFHLLHFTVQVTHPDYRELTYMLHGEKVHDVYAMVVRGFSDVGVSAFYIVAMGLLCLHLSHGFASVFQTLGLRTARTRVVLKWLGITYALVIFFGNISIPISILAKLGPFAAS